METFALKQRRGQLRYVLDRARQRYLCLRKYGDGGARDVRMVKHLRKRVEFDTPRGDAETARRVLRRMLRNEPRLRYAIESERYWAMRDELAQIELLLLAAERGWRAV